MSEHKPKCQSASQNFKVQAKTSKRESKQRASQNIKVESKHQSASQSVKAQAEMSKRGPKRQSVSQNIYAQAETSKRECQSVKAWGKRSKRQPKRQSVSGTLPWTLFNKIVAQDKQSAAFTVAGIMCCYGYVGLDVFLPIVIDFVLFKVRYHWEIFCFDLIWFGTSSASLNIKHEPKHQASRNLIPWLSHPLLKAEPSNCNPKTNLNIKIFLFPIFRFWDFNFKTWLPPNQWSKKYQ